MMPWAGSDAMPSNIGAQLPSACTASPARSYQGSWGASARARGALAGRRRPAAVGLHRVAGAIVPEQLAGIGLRKGDHVRRRALVEAYVAGIELSAQSPS